MDLYKKIKRKYSETLEHIKVIWLFVIHFKLTLFQTGHGALVFLCDTMWQASLLV